MKKVSTFELSPILMTSLMMARFAMIAFMMISLMAGHRAVLEGHYRRIVEKNPYDDQNPNAFLEHFLLFSL